MHCGTLEVQDIQMKRSQNVSTSQFLLFRHLPLSALLRSFNIVQSIYIFKFILCVVDNVGKNSSHLLYRNHQINPQRVCRFPIDSTKFLFIHLHSFGTTPSTTIEHAFATPSNKAFLRLLLGNLFEKLISWLNWGRKWNKIDFYACSRTIHSNVQCFASSSPMNSMARFKRKRFPFVPIRPQKTLFE